MSEYDNVINMMQRFSDEKLDEIIHSSLGSMKREQEMFRLALAEKARRRLGVNRYTEDDIA